MIEVFDYNLELAKRKRINEGIEHKFKPDIRVRYRVCYTVKESNRRYTRLFDSLEQAKFIYGVILDKNKDDKYKDICLYEVNEQRRKIKEVFT